MNSSPLPSYNPPLLPPYQQSTQPVYDKTSPSLQEELSLAGHRLLSAGINQVNPVTLMVVIYLLTLFLIDRNLLFSQNKVIFMIGLISAVAKCLDHSQHTFFIQLSDTHFRVV